eukprot:92670_1
MSTPLGFVYMAIISGSIGLTVIAIIGIHCVYHEQQDKIGSRFSRGLSITFFTISCLSCLAFTLFRTNMILPMGESISCHFGYYFSIQGVYLSKILLFVIFLYRIHLAFHSSTMRYSPLFLKINLLVYFIICTAGNIWHTIATEPLIHLQTLTLSTTSIAVCTTVGKGTEMQQDLRRNALVFISIGDVIYSIFICWLFIRKLRVVIKLVDVNTETHSGRKYAMMLLCRKQTILVIFACTTSILTIGMSSQVSGFGLMVSFDLMTNAICVWFMYSFNKHKWYLFIKYVCCCCYCCIFKEDSTHSMRALSDNINRSSKIDSKSPVKTKSENHNQTIIPITPTVASEHQK